MADQGGYGAEYNVDPNYHDDGSGRYHQQPHPVEDGGYVDNGHAQGGDYYDPHQQGGYVDDGQQGYPIDGGNQMQYDNGYDPQQQQQYGDVPGGDVGYLPGGQQPPPYGADGDGGFSEGIPDVLYLNHFCANAFPPQDDSEEARMQADASWEPVRDWLRTHSAQEVLEAAEQRDDVGKTALHFACQNVPPKDVIDVFLSIAANTVQWPDTSGWLPIHYACAYGADTEVIKNLADAFPECKTTVDRKGRTPLHFALGSSSSNSYDVIVLLTPTGAAGYKDENGMLPLHYACAYGASEESFLVLTNAYPDAIATVDRWGRTPLHFALSNAGRKNAPSAVRLLLSLNKSVVNSVGGGRLPLRVLSEFASTLKKSDEACEYVQACLEYLLAAEPEPTADFFTALQSLPTWLQERAVVLKVVQVLLNEKISQRFPSLILLCDLYFQTLVVASYSICQIDLLRTRFNDPDVTPNWRTLDKKFCLAFLYIGTTYFLAREVIQILSLLALGAIRIWFYEPTNWLNVFYIGLMYYWAIEFTAGNLEDADAFRTWSALSLMVIYLKFMAYLRNILLQFSVFIGGVANCLIRLAAFFVCLMIILVAFSRMLFTIFQQTDYCAGEQLNSTDPEVIEAQQCDALETNPWCDGWASFITIYTMMLGEVDETKFTEDRFAMVLFAVFMFLVVILLANVLIAIVTDSYKVIQDQRAAIVFWTNRLDFVAQMDAIANGPWKTRVRRFFGLTDNVEHHKIFGVNFGKDMWRRLMDVFEDDVEESLFSIEFLCQTALRIATLLFVIPGWIVLGIISAGWFWPPQIREYIFTSTISKHSSETEKEDELRKNQLDEVRSEIDVLRGELQQELAVDRTNLVQLKSVVAAKKMEIQNEMKHIKRVVAMLFEQQGGGM